MLHTHLENFTSDFPIIAVALKAEATKPSFSNSISLKRRLRDPARLSETLARLTGLLGADRVGTPVLEETHRPDAFRMEPFSWQLQETEAETDAVAFLRPAPISLAGAGFDVAGEKSARLIFAAPKFRATCSRQKGPYTGLGKLVGRKSWERAEWDLELENGALCQCHSRGGRWELDGVYD